MNSGGKGGSGFDALIAATADWSSAFAPDEFGVDIDSPFFSGVPVEERLRSLTQAGQRPAPVVVRAGQVVPVLGHVRVGLDQLRLQVVGHLIVLERLRTLAVGVRW